MALGGVALTLEAWQGASWGFLGVLAAAAATAAWATDNTLTRPLAERDPLDVVAAKGGIGAAITGAIALAIGEPLPSLVPMAALLACGATGYRLSLRLYLLAQRRIGAGRTGSVFALAPFIGAGLAYALGDRHPSMWTLGAVALPDGVLEVCREEVEHVDRPADFGQPELLGGRPIGSGDLGERDRVVLERRGHLVPRLLAHFVFDDTPLARP